MEAAWIGEQASTEIEYVAMGVTLAQHRNKSKYVTLKTETFGIGLDQTFAGQLGGAIERGLDGKRSRFGRGEYCGLSIDRAGRRKCDPFDAVGAHRFQHVERRNRILLEI